MTIPLLSKVAVKWARKAVEEHILYLKKTFYRVLGPRLVLKDLKNMFKNTFYRVIGQLLGLKDEEVLKDGALRVWAINLNLPSLMSVVN
jgi:hypothetical protein